MNTLLYAGALVLSFALGGVTTLVAFPRHTAVTAEAASTISPTELTRSVGPLPVEFLENYF
jgi:hypothetical protein